MKIKTSELQGAALDWAVAKCEGEGKLAWAKHRDAFAFSSTWVCGGPIIERAGLDTLAFVPELERWVAYKDDLAFVGDTLLIAAMRCYVASKLGDEVDVPEELQ